MAVLVRRNQGAGTAGRRPRTVDGADAGVHGRVRTVVDAIDQVTVAPDDRTLTASFGGAPAGGPCGADYSAYAVQGARAVGIVVVPVPTKRTGNYACTAQAVGRTITVHLDQPLNDRVVIETVHGAAVQVSH
jgi:hypothetical protein